MTSKERAVVFSGAMVRAILSGAKTQTRGAIKPQPFETSYLDGPDQYRPSLAEDGRLRVATSTGVHLFSSPFGQLGDRLWVQETWAPRALGRWSMLEKHMLPLYRATEERPKWKGIWRPSIHMPRWACRLVLEITDVRVERLQAISEADAEAEGATADVLPNIRLPGAHPRAGLPMIYAGARQIFADLWDSTDGDWANNPWVWAISFRQIEEHACS
ncbi:hypothetical protein EDF77_1879 [Stenotrophomonas maltophilia]|uniref:hypothetical protein n=1 Tax=Stenotrophomonas chelatiphaga TaxID=517011 RepID=UPI000F4B5CE9|nr:hypothetical protein [Stenotrophomonas chelatiphaga]MCS4231410.1 hypothetical protein [Stenotrophomonas chelatiphaga]ROQ42407.1 hypothetical protein EDF77_1879 [Stenotrophomonas maltophilia]